MEPFLVTLAVKVAAKTILRGSLGAGPVKPDDSGADLIDGGIDLLV